ncbi:MAG TPA: hypothetical protein VGG01_10920 [Xanthobacteraceae bacterium]|jgi:hypothetical protein
MPLEFSLPFLALSGAALTALAYRFWPRIAVRMHAEKHGRIGVREIAVSITRPRFSAKAVSAATHEFVIYMTMKSCN